MLFFTRRMSTFQLLITSRRFSFNVHTPLTTSRYGTTFLRGLVMEVDLASDPKRLIITSTNIMLEDVNLTIKTRAVILATGSKSRWLGVRVACVMVVWVECGLCLRWPVVRRFVCPRDIARLPCTRNVLCLVQHLREFKQISALGVSLLHALYNTRAHRRRFHVFVTT